MQNNIEKLDYIRSQLAWIKSKVELDNQLGLYDINKLVENIFMHILNDVFDWNLHNANLIQENFPAIDLVDDTNKIVVQVTSTTATDKLRNTIEKFHKLEEYNDYQLKIFYIKNKPNFQKKSLEEFEKNGVYKEGLIGIDDIVKTIQANPTKCAILYKTIQSRFDAISFTFNIDDYFKNFEPHIQNDTSEKFRTYKDKFIGFIKSDKKILEVYAVGGNGKSHLLKYLSSIETEYTPLIFTKQINIEEDLKKLDLTKKYLFIFDDIDRFLEYPILETLLSYTITHTNIKLVLSYRSSSKDIIKNIYRKYNSFEIEEIEIVWSEEEIKQLIKSINPNLSEQKVLVLMHTFNNNPYLITQALKEDIDNIQKFSQKIIDDAGIALNDMGLNNEEIEDLLFELSILTPILKNNVSKNYQNNINKLVKAKILRELASSYRFNPDIIGDIYLAYYVDKNKEDFEKIVEKYLSDFSDNVFTNLSYALTYNESDSLQSFIKKIISKWIDDNEYRNDYLALVNKVVYYAPMESFVYLEKATKKLTPKSINALGMDGTLTQFATKYNPPNGDWSSDSDAINLESIEPIISKIVHALKYNLDCEGVTIKHIINYLVSDEVLSLPKPYYDNQTLDSIFSKIVSPLNTINFKINEEALRLMSGWIEEEPTNQKKIYLLQKSLKSLLSALVDDSSYEGFTFTFSQIPLNLKHPSVLEIIDLAKKVIFKLIESDDKEKLFIALDIISDIGGYRLEDLGEDYIRFYSELKKELLDHFVDKSNYNDDFELKATLENILIKILRFSTYQPLIDKALDALSKIERSDEYILYLMVKGVDFLIVDFDEFMIDYAKEKNNKDFWFDSQKQRMYYYEFSDKETAITNNLSNKYTVLNDFISLLNTLDMSNWNAYRTLSKILNIWFENRQDIFIELSKQKDINVSDQIIKNVLNEVFLLKGLKEININEITESTIDDDLQVYIDVIFKNYDTNKIEILNKIIDVIENKETNKIRMFISIISQRMYFAIADDNSRYGDMEHIILKFLQWQYKYKFNIESYLTYHILRDIAKKNDLSISEDIVNELRKFVKSDDIAIDEYDLKPIYEILDYGLRDVVDNLYNKLTSLDENNKPKHIFSHYFDYDKVAEVLLIKSFVNNFEDFEVLINKVWELCSKPVQFIGADGNSYEEYVNLDYFFKYTINKEYISQIFDNFYKNNDKEKIVFFYSIVPVSLNYIDLIVKNLNFLDMEIDDKKLIEYLIQLGKIKVYSSSPMQNSDTILEEEKIFQILIDKVESLSLQLKIKEELKYIKLRKRQEIEQDISYLLDR